MLSARPTTTKKMVYESLEKCAAMPTRQATTPRPTQGSASCIGELYPQVRRCEMAIRLLFEDSSPGLNSEASLTLTVRWRFRRTINSDDQP
jgi:hypothetical protein